MPVCRGETTDLALGEILHAAVGTLQCQGDLGVEGIAASGRRPLCGRGWRHGGRTGLDAGDLTLQFGDPRGVVLAQESQFVAQLGDGSVARQCGLGDQ